MFPQSWRVPAWHKISLGSLTGHSTDFTKRVSYENTLCNQLAGLEPAPRSYSSGLAHTRPRMRTSQKHRPAPHRDLMRLGSSLPSLFLELPGRVVTIKREVKLMLQPEGRVIRLMKSSLRMALVWITLLTQPDERGICIFISSKFRLMTGLNASVVVVVVGLNELKQVIILKGLVQLLWL